MSDPCLTGCIEFESRCKKCNRLLCAANVGPQWISVKYQNPNYDELVLITDGKTVKQGYRHNCLPDDPDEEDRYYIGEGFVFDEVTHWMPLPEVPNAVKTYLENKNEV